MAYTVHIRNNLTGEIRSKVWADIPWDGDFIWSEGNFACDCNREIFFKEAAGHDTKQLDSDCGEGRFTVWIDDDGGARLYADDGAPLEKTDA